MRWATDPKVFSNPSSKFSGRFGIFFFAIFNLLLR
jgi:hypothetical protein